jgi:hypothetical protein
MKFERSVLCEKGAVKKKYVFSSTVIADGKRAFFTDNGRHAGRLGYFLEYVNRINLRAEMEQGVL